MVKPATKMCNLISVCNIAAKRLDSDVARFAISDVNPVSVFTQLANNLIVPREVSTWVVQRATLQLFQLVLKQFCGKKSCAFLFCFPFYSGHGTG